MTEDLKVQPIAQSSNFQVVRMGEEGDPTVLLPNASILECEAYIRLRQAGYIVRS